MTGAETIAGNKTFSNSISVGGATIRSNEALYFPNTITNRKIVLWASTSNNDYQNYSLGMQDATMQFMVTGSTSKYTFSYATSASAKADFAQIDASGINIKTGNLLLNGTNILTRSNVWGSNTSVVNTFTSSTPTEPVFKVELNGANLLVYKDASSSLPRTSLVDTSSGVIQIGSTSGITGANGPLRTELIVQGIFSALYGAIIMGQSSDVGDYIAKFRNSNNADRISIYDEGGSRARPQIAGESGAGIEITSSYGVYITSTSNDAHLRKIVLNATSGVEVLGANGISAVAFRATSDIRLKTNIIPLEPQLDKIKSLVPYSFNWKEDNRNDYGFIAQDVFKKYPIMNFTSHKEDEPIDNSGNPIYHSFDYSKLTTILWKGLQETVHQVETQETQIKSLEETVQSQQTQIEQLQKQIQMIFDTINIKT